eukprot:scaffold14209_cov85-Cylindrotheca_fusiformis.AAC.1
MVYSVDSPHPESQRRKLHYWKMAYSLQLKPRHVRTTMDQEKWGVDTVDSRFAQRIAPHDTHDDVSSLARDERELSNGHAGGDAATVAHFSCGPTTVTDSFS